ncbi:unnamed protein product [Heterobilharzia americana]|nr:unnamed protein product [Heterobilharzia americana]
MAFALDEDKRCQLNEDIIKQLYLVAYMQGSKLPTCLVTNSKCSKVQVRGDGRTAVDMRSHVHQTVLPVVIKADNPIPVSCSVYYFEITVNVKSRSGLLALGVCSSRSSTNEWPGMEFTSYGYHSNSGTVYHNSKELPVSAPTFGESDIIGCGVNFVNNSVFFTKNGVFIGPISAGKKLPHPVYPCIAFACPNCHVSINFGHHKFAFDIGQYIGRERAMAVSTAVDRKCNDQLAYVTMRNLVATYLLHNGFLESAQALGEWVKKASSTVIDHSNLNDNKKDNVCDVNETNDEDHQSPIQLKGEEEQQQFKSAVSQYNLSTNNSVKPSDTVLNDLFRWPEAVDILLRRRHLRETIRSGDYLSALDQLQAHFKTLWENDPSITFVLKCHHFIDLIRRHYTTNSSKESICPNKLSTIYWKTLQSNGNSDLGTNFLAETNTSTIANNNSQLCRSVANNCDHSHSLSNYQAPIRLPLESVPHPQWNDGLLSSSADKYASEILPTNGSVFVTSGTVATNNSSEIICPVVFPSYTENNFIKASEFITNGNSVFPPLHDSPSPPISTKVSSSIPNKSTDDNNSINNDKQNGIYHPISNGICNEATNCNGFDDDYASTAAAEDDELHDLIEYGRNLRSNALELQHQGAISLEQLLLLSNAFSLVAYQNPYKSPLNSLLHPKHRELLADAINDAILVHLKQPSRPVLDIALTYLEHVLSDEGSSCKTTGSFPCYRFKHDQLNSGPVVHPLQSLTSPQLQSNDVCTVSRVSQTSASTTPVTHGTPTTPIRSTTISGGHREMESRYATADIQTYGLTSGEFVETSSNGSTNLLRPASTSVISSSLYVPPSALISLTGRSNPVTRSSDSHRSSSRVRPTSLQNLIQQRRQSQSTDQPTSSPPSSHLNRFLVTSSNWPVSTPVSSSTTTNTTAGNTSQNPNRFSPSRITVTSSLTNTHAPTGPELAGFFHPILFIG